MTSKFGNPYADLSDITDTSFVQYTFPEPRAQLLRSVTAADVAAALGRTKPWKAPGHDGLPVGFLRACGLPLCRAIADLTNASFMQEHFPRCFRAARTVVLPKQGKTIEVMQTPGGWRPIALLSTVGKVIESIMGQCIAEAAEACSLLPEG